MRRNSLAYVFLKSRLGMTGFVIFALFCLTAALGPLILPYDPLTFGEASEVLNPPGPGHPMGTDDMGRDVLSALVAGSGISLTVGILATLISMVLGTIIGLASGFSGGWLDNLLMRITDIFLVLPWLPLMLILAALLGASVWNIILVIGLTGWAASARLVRAQTLTVKERQYVERAKVIGAPRFRIVMDHVLPNVFPLVFANTILVTATSILSETTLSFLGMGDSTRPSWGTMLHFAFESGAVSRHAWWFIVPPGLCVLLLVLSFTFMGYALDEILNPKLRSR